jgi:hypothetical protein
MGRENHHRQTITFLSQTIDASVKNKFLKICKNLDMEFARYSYYPASAGFGLLALREKL